MTVLMPKDAYAVLHGDSPVIGNAEEIEAVIDFLASVEEETFRYQGEISQARLDLVHSKSQTTGKLSEKIDVALFPGSMILSDGVIDAKGAFTRYLGEVKDIHRKADDLLSRVTGELETVRTNAREIEVIASAIGVSSNFNWDVGPPKNMPEPTVVVEVSDDPLFRKPEDYRPATWRGCATNWLRALNHIRDERRKWSGLYERRMVAERALVQALSSTTLGQLITLSAGDSGSRVSLIAQTIAGEAWGGKFAPPTGTIPLGLRRLLDDSLDPYQVNEEWQKLNLTPEDLAELPLAAIVELASLNGIPAWAQDIASRRLLDYAKVFPLGAYRLMGFQPAVMSLDEFTAQVNSLDAELENTELSAMDLPGRPTVQLIGFGSHDFALTAAISLGDLDIAKNVSINVPGMNSNVGDVGPTVSSAINLYNEAHSVDKTSSYAVVSWFGYHSPTESSVGQMARAQSGGKELASFLDGIHAIRPDDSTHPVEQFTVLAHSYGSTTATEALKAIKFDIDTFVTYGSAGIQHGTTLDQLHIRDGNMYSTIADGDGVAPIGYVLATLSGDSRDDPRDMEGVHVFLSEGNGINERETTVHDMYTVGNEWSVVNKEGKIGYMAYESSSMREMAHLIAKGNLRPPPIPVMDNPKPSVP